jgi:hypothetical protein
VAVSPFLQYLASSRQNLASDEVQIDVEESGLLTQVEEVRRLEAAIALRLPELPFFSASDLSM